jgi:hypothetical protein
MTLTSALVPRAIMPMSVDFPTPEPAMMPTRWPLPRVKRPFMARTPTSRGSEMRGLSRGLGGSAKMGRNFRGKMGPISSMGLPKASTVRPRKRRPTGISGGVEVFLMSVPGLMPRMSP